MLELLAQVMETAQQGLTELDEDIAQLQLQAIQSPTEEAAATARDVSELCEWHASGNPAHEQGTPRGKQ